MELARARWKNGDASEVDLITSNMGGAVSDTPRRAWTPSRNDADRRAECDGGTSNFGAGQCIIL